MTALVPRLRAPWVLYLIAGTLAAAGFAASHAAWATWGATAVQASAGIAVLYGAIRRRPQRPLFWWLLGAGQLMYALAQGYWRIRFDGWRGLIPFGDVNDAFYLAALLLFIAALAVGPRPRSRDGAGAGTIDGAAVVLGLAFGTWNLIAEPYVDSGRLTTWGIAVFLTYEGLEVLRMALLARIVLGGRLTGSIGLMATGMLIQLSADLVYGVSLLSPSGAVDAWQNAGWIIGSVCIGAAGLHPGMNRYTREKPPENTVSRARLALFLLLILIYPSTTLLDAALGGTLFTSAFLTTALLPLLLVVGVAALLIVRLGLLTGVAQRQAAEMRRALQAEGALRDRLTYQATHDPLTGLANRTVLTDALAAPGRTGTLLFIDLENFKEVNDHHGHPVGDAVLAETAQRLVAAAPGAVTARLGGDEFAVLTDRVGPGADDLAVRIVAVLGRPCTVDGLELRVAATIGLVELDGSDPAATMRDVDLALYAAKENGPDRVVRFHAGLREAWTRRTSISHGLGRALLDGGLALHYQPIIDLATGRVTAVEALMRWTPPDGPPVSPVEFIPVAEQTGLIADLGLWALRRAATDARGWYERHGTSVTVNVSARQLEDPRFCADVLAVLRSCGLPGPALTLEITESMLIGVAGAVSASVTGALHELRSHGIRIAIDDFGTGYSSLSYLHELPVDVLKLDRSLTLSSDPTPQKAAIARAAIELGNALNLLTVAEGVESAEQAAVLRDMGCPRAQGFHFARPLPAAAVTDLLAANAVVG